MATDSRHDHTIESKEIGDGMKVYVEGTCIGWVRQLEAGRWYGTSTVNRRVKSVATRTDFETAFEAVLDASCSSTRGRAIGPDPDPRGDDHDRDHDTRQRDRHAMGRAAPAAGPQPREVSDPDAASALIEEIATEIDDLVAFCDPDPAEYQVGIVPVLLGRDSRHPDHSGCLRIESLDRILSNLRR